MSKQDPKQNEDALRRALLAMRQMRTRLDTLEAEHAGPIAVVGMGCRYPGGGNDPDSYWDLIVNGKDAVREVPLDRWNRDAFYDPNPEAAGRMYTKHGGFIDEPGRNFDAAFFGIAPREAVATDPQHRLLLEVSWEALENAGLSAQRLMGSRTGVFVGISTTDYAQLRYSTGGLGAIDPYSVLGTSASFAAGRLAYTFGFQGPTVPVDTACSSSLVAAHMAMLALRRRECDIALAGGVNLILSPMLMIYFCKLRALSVQGRCRTFDASADGYVRGEGCGMLVLKRLEDAQADGDRILAVLRGSAINHDGRSGGITVPNGPSQQAVIKQALLESGIDPAHVDYVEAHGTGTPLGDPIEMQALAATYGKAKRQHGPLIIGSVKTQIGHLEAAAGVAGLSRVILALQHRKMPAHLHFEKLNPHIESALAGRFNYRLPQVGEDWQDTGQSRAAAISSFGINGTNVHMVLEQAPEPESRETLKTRPEVLVISAKNDTALRQQVQNYQRVLDSQSPPALIDLCHSAATGRVHFPVRATFAGELAEISSQMEQWLKNTNYATEQEAESPLAFLFPGNTQELQRVAPQLAARFPVFNDSLQKITSPRSYALQYALLCLWQSYGLRPQWVAGEGIGRVTAAVAAGALSPEEGSSLAQALVAEAALPGGINWRSARIEWRDGSINKSVHDAKALNWHDANAGLPRAPNNFEVLSLIVKPAQSADLYIAQTLQGLYSAGITPEWTQVEPQKQFKRVVLPSYPFQRENFWGADAPVAPGTEQHRDAASNKLSVLRPAWRPSPIRTGQIPQKIQLLTAEGFLAEATVKSFTAAGIRVETLYYLSHDVLTGLQVRRENGELTTLGNNSEDPLVDIRFIDPDQNYQLVDLLVVLQALPESGGNYWLASSHAFAIRDEEGAVPLQAALWAMASSLGLERPELNISAVDMDEAEPELLVREISREGQTKEPVVWRLGERFVRRIEAIEPPDEQAEFRKDAAYLVTGGFGGIGQQLVRWLASRGALNIIVPSRRGTDDPRMYDLADLDVNLQVIHCDLTETSAVTQLLSCIEQPLAGIFHVAGITEDALIAQQTTQSLAKVIAAKADVAFELDKHSRDLPLEHFVMFSSMAGVSGSAAQANYAAANAMLQALAHRRRAEGHCALCVHWGLWDGPGMAAKLSEQDRARLARQGVHPMPALAALNTLAQLMTGNEAEYMVGLFDGVDVTDSSEKQHWKARIEECAPEMRSDLVAQCLKENVAQVLGMPANQIASGANLFDLGFDSLMVMDLVKLLKEALGCALYPRELYQTPLISELCDYLLGAMTSESQPAQASEAPSATPWSAAPLASQETLGDPVANIGFILSAPRSGSTLLRVMLAGHPDLFVPPELHLLPFKTMAERSCALQDSYLDEGLVRAVMELRGCDAAQAKSELQLLTEQRTPIQEVYRQLAELAGERQVIDKSPSYANHLVTLERAERLCTEPRYIHLVRHPYAMIESFMRQRMDRLIGVQGADAFELAESIWREMTKNILQLSNRVGAKRCLLVTYEDLVREPQVQLQRISKFLGVDYNPAVLDPYSGAASRMTDGISERSLSVGDPDFSSHKTIDPALAEAWQKVELPRELSAESADLAQQLGYQLPPVKRRSKPREVAMYEHTVSGEGLELNLCRWGDPQAPCVLCLHGVLEQGAVFSSLANELVRSGFQVLAPDLRGHGKSDRTAASSTYQMADFVADLNCVIRNLEIAPMTLLGMSLGAAIATLYTVARPETVRELILVEPPLARRSDAREASKTLRAQLTAKRPVDTCVADLNVAAQRLLSVYPGMSQQQAETLAQHATDNRNSELHWRWDPRLRAPVGIASDASSNELMAEIQVPHYLVFGRQGDLLNARDWRAGCNTHLEKVVTLDGGHNLHVSAPDALASIVIECEQHHQQTTPKY